jgi:hypothetical protein
MHGAKISQEEKVTWTKINTWFFAPELCVISFGDKCILRFYDRSMHSHNKGDASGAPAPRAVHLEVQNSIFNPLFRFYL